MKLASDILATKQALALAKKEAEEARNSVSFDSQKIINADLKVENLEDGLKRLGILGTEMELA